MENPDLPNIIKLVLESNGYSVSLIAGHPMLLSVCLEGAKEDCLTYLTYTGGGDASAQAEIFARTEDNPWVELNLHDPRGYDELLEQLAEYFGKDQL
jgi:hypothetical protein